MAVSLKHIFQSPLPDGPDATLVRPSNWNDEHTLTLGTGKIIGRSTAGTGAAEEISIGSGLSLSGGSLANSAPDQTVTLTAGTGVSVTGTYPSFTIDNTAPNQIVSLTAGPNITITGSYPSFTIEATSGGGGLDQAAALKLVSLRL
jgi:hypothetical protein